MKRYRPITTYICMICEEALELEAFFYCNYKTGICQKCLDNAKKREKELKLKL